jgi:hypothetical protein
MYRHEMKKLAEGRRKPLSTMRSQSRSKKKNTTFFFFFLLLLLLSFFFQTQTSTTSTIAERCIRNRKEYSEHKI